MHGLIEKELNSQDKILKPDFNSKTGRELLAFYLQTKFKQILVHDKHRESPMFISCNPNFIARFTKRLINQPQKRLVVGITGEGAAVCRTIKKFTEHRLMPVCVISTDDYDEVNSEKIIIIEGTADMCDVFDVRIHVGTQEDTNADFVLNANMDLHYFEQILEYIYAVTNHYSE